MKYYEKNLRENNIFELKKLIGGKVFYISFPYLNIIADEKKMSFESGTIFVNSGDISYEVTFMSKWSETLINSIDYKEFVIDTNVSASDIVSCQMNYDKADPNRESKVILPASNIRSIVIYESCIQSKNENISFDSHIVLILENEIVLIFELESDMTDFIDLIITDIKNSDNVIKDYGNKNGDYSVNISQRILLENKE